MADDNQKNTADNQIKLYGFLIDQLSKYNAIIWQAPTALFAANILALDKMSSKPFFILGLFLFNSAMIFACYKMILRQGEIIKAAKKAEDILKTEFQDFIPNFKTSGTKAPWSLVWTLGILNALLFIYFLYLICPCIC